MPRAWPILECGGLPPLCLARGLPRVPLVGLQLVANPAHENSRPVLCRVPPDWRTTQRSSRLVSIARTR